MAYIEVSPKSTEAQQRLTEECAVLMSMLHRAAKDVLGIPDYDIIVELNQCTVIAFNPESIKANATPDVVIKIGTSDHDFQPKFQELCDCIVNSWKSHFGDQLTMELCINLIDTWGCNIDFD